MIKLGVNVDHVATLRQARAESWPDPVAMAQLAIAGGADGITAHLREDRRHIQDSDVFRLKASISRQLNLEMAATPEILSIAVRLKPDWCCLVPERRQELTTEGGLDLAASRDQIKSAIQLLHDGGIRVSLFIEPDIGTVGLAREIGADAVELHTGSYSKAWGNRTHISKPLTNSVNATWSGYDAELSRLTAAAHAADGWGLLVNAGHGLDYDNVKLLVSAFGFNEFNIGYAIIARSLAVGIQNATAEMKNILRESLCVES